MSQVIHLTSGSHNAAQKPKQTKALFFSKDEFRELLNSYSMQVAQGVWKDYAIDSNSQSATFSIFRHSFEMPVFAISKRRNGKYFEFALSKQGHVLKRSRDLHDLLTNFANPVWMKKHS